MGGSGFWGRSKPYCSFCGWNLEAAKEMERASLKQLPRGLLLLAFFFAFVGYLDKSGFALFPFLFLSTFVVVGTIAAWRKLKLLETSHPAAAYTNSLMRVSAAEQNINQVSTKTYQYLRTLSKPRRVRLKQVPRVITIAFPISWIFIAYFGYQIVRDQIAVSGPIATLGELWFLLLFAFIWSVIGISTIRSVQRDRKLLTEGELAMAIVTHQELSGGKNRQSKIRYEFKDAAGRPVFGEGTDESWELYEDMELSVFYDSEDPGKNVALCAATYELKTN
jgi:hypothetical protein